MTIKWILLKMCYLPPLPFTKHNTKLSHFSNFYNVYLKCNVCLHVIVALVEKQDVNVEGLGSIPVICYLFSLKIILFKYAFDQP